MSLDEEIVSFKILMKISKRKSYDEYIYMFFLS